jgi:glycosyltransferase involved in cell wall biosynthesis
VRICHVINIGFEAGGAEKVVRLISEAMRLRGHEVSIIATDHRLADHTPFADVIVPEITGNPVVRVAKFFWHQAAYREVRAAVARFRPDVVHLHTIGLFSPSVLRATAAYPQVVTVHGPEDWTLELLEWNLASRSTGSGRLTLADRARYGYLRFVQRPAYLPRIRAVDRVLAPSQYYAHALRRDVGRVPTHVVPNGIELPARSPVPRDGRILCVGRLETIKGARVLVEAFATVVERHPEAHLTLIGRGPEQREIEALVHRLGLVGHVRVAGFVPDEELLECYHRATAVVIPSICPENFPTVALEAIGIGRALVATRVGGLPELVTDGDNGFLVPAGDAPALAGAITRILDDPDLAVRMGEASAGRSAEYAIDLYLDRLETHYRELVGAGPVTTNAADPTCGR